MQYILFTMAVMKLNEVVIETCMSEIKNNAYLLHRHLLDYNAEIRKTMCLRPKHEQINWVNRESNAEDTYRDLIRNIYELHRLLGYPCVGGEEHV